MTAPLPFHSLDASLFERAQSLLDEDWLSKDVDLAPVLPMVLARGVGQDWHKAGTFRHHLVGVARTLAQWQQPREVRLLGLLHSVRRPCIGWHRCGPEPRSASAHSNGPAFQTID